MLLDIDLGLHSKHTYWGTHLARFVRLWASAIMSQPKIVSEYVLEPFLGVTNLGGVTNFVWKLAKY